MLTWCGRCDCRWAFDELGLQFMQYILKKSDISTQYAIKSL